MDAVLIVTIIRSLALEHVEHALQGMGVRGMTVTRVEGRGEYANFFARNHKVEELKVEIFVERERADAIVQRILDIIHTGLPGDGLVAILPAEKIFSGRTHAEVIPERTSTRRSAREVGCNVPAA
jgi:nitrogen regulatory protein P-II 1